MSAPASTNMLCFYQKPRLGYLCFCPGFNPPHSQWFQLVEEAHTYQPHQWDCKMNRAEVEWMVQEMFPLAAPPDSPVLESYSNSPQTWQCSFPFFFFSLWSENSFLIFICHCHIVVLSLCERGWCTWMCLGWFGAVRYWDVIVSIAESKRKFNALFHTLSKYQLGFF